MRAPDPPSLQDGRLTLGPLVNAAGQNAFRVAPAGAVSHVDIDGDLGGVRGKVVVVGALRGDRDLHRTLDGPRYGAELLAVEVETLLRQAAPREASPELGALYTMIVTLASGLLPRGRAGPALVATLLGVALATGGLLMPFLAPLLGSVVVTRVPSPIFFRDRRGSV